MEEMTVTRNVDFAVHTSLTISNGMPVHKKEAFGAFDSEFAYENGHEI